MTIGMLVGIDDTLTECSSASFVCMTVTAGWRHMSGGPMTSLWRRHDFFYITCLFTVCLIFGMMRQDVFRVTPPPEEVRPRANLCSYRLVLVAIGIRLPRVLRKPIVVFTARSVSHVARYCHDKLFVRMSVRL